MEVRGGGRNENKRELKRKATLVSLWNNNTWTYSSVEIKQREGSSKNRTPR